MRLGQLARKHDIPLQEIITFLDEEIGELGPFTANSKLDEDLEKNIFDHFQIELPEEPEAVVENETSEPETSVDEVHEELEPTEDVEEPIIEEELPKTAAEEIALVEGEIAFGEPEKNVALTEELSANNVEEEIEESTAPKEDEIIQTDKLLELLEEGEELPSELEKIKLIKAPKKELSGLKVLGKIDIPEPKKKEESKEEEDKRKNGRGRKPQLSEEEKEKRRLRAKRKKEAFEARQEKRRKEKEAQKKKAKKTAHYQQQVTQPKSPKEKQRIKSIENGPPPAPKKQPKPKPKTVFGKIWRWLNPED